MRPSIEFKGSSITYPPFERSVVNNKGHVRSEHTALRIEQLEPTPIIITMWFGVRSFLYVHDTLECEEAKELLDRAGIPNFITTGGCRAILTKATSALR